MVPRSGPPASSGAGIFVVEQSGGRWSNFIHSAAVSDTVLIVREKDRAEHAEPRLFLRRGQADRV